MKPTTIITGYHSMYRRQSYADKIKSWGLSPANKFEQSLGIAAIAFGAVIGLELAIVEIIMVSL
ncbi:MAG: hypothetical protein IJ184_07340 [Alphaproteobacteria bacterium]|nr:hypothetical protein [Alphaproteobacteria bacterium]